ncbi:DNA-3-methyladenine glycosylase [Simkania sp.]|uniref:DNA-3-methyladenine glycosylase n=1 Tax=Simkania sp. TaxID=34094 RepID=UPI003B51B13D
MDSFARRLETAKVQKQEVLPQTYFQKEDVTQIAQEILGKFLFTEFQGTLTGGVITETEAYKGAEDKACHAYQNRRTKRTEVMFGAGGTAYVYLCYGMHHLFNIVTHSEGTPHAILIRAIFPTHGIEKMLKRRKKNNLDKTLTAGPGSLSQALGIQTKHSGTSLTGPTIWLEDRGLLIEKKDILSSPRIGIDYAEEHALLPWRFHLPNNIFFP